MWESEKSSDQFGLNFNITFCFNSSFLATLPHKIAEIPLPELHEVSRNIILQCMDTWNYFTITIISNENNIYAHLSKSLCFISHKC